MQKKIIRSIVFIAVILFVAYNSVYFKKLDEVKAASAAKQFDAPAYARNFLDKKLLPNLDKAIEINTLLNLVQTTPDRAFTNYSHALGIGNVRYFLVQGEGTVTAIDENDVTLSIHTDSTHHTITLATEFVYGNAIRDASGLIDINEFSSTMDFNNVSAETNKIIRAEVLPPFKANAKPGNKVKFYGALELNQAHINLENIEVIPIRLAIVK